MCAPIPVIARGGNQPWDASAITLDQVNQTLEAFRGPILQVAAHGIGLKHQGRPLYKLAREGVEIERPARPVTIYSLDLLAFNQGPAAELVLDIHCSKGTYIRSIASDLGDALGVGGHVVNCTAPRPGPSLLRKP